MPQTAELMWYILAIGVIGVGAMLIGILASRLLRKRLRNSRPTEVFTIQDLREMRRREDITQQEYETMRAAIIGRVADAPQPEPRKTSPIDPETGSERPNASSDQPPDENR